MSATLTRNEAGGRAYDVGPRHALARLAATGCLSNTFYASGEGQLDKLLALVEQVDAAFLAKLCVYARRRGRMKDMPAAVLLALAKKDAALFRRAFPLVVDSGRVLRTFVKLLREGRFGRKGLSSALQKAVQRWLNTASVAALLSASIGSDPSLRDVLRLARPTPIDDERRAFFGWLTGKPHDAEMLPEAVRALIAFRAGDEAEQLAILAPHRFRWDLIADAVRSPAVWKAVARQMAPQALRMNLNTLLRHGVFSDPAMVEEVAARLGDPAEVRRSGQMPYQYLAAFLNAEAILPASIRAGLERAAEAACESVPAFSGPVVVGLDVSGSMGSSVTGVQGRKTPSKVRCVDVAALFAAAVVRRTPGSVVVPFDTAAHAASVGPGEGILALAWRLAAYGGGGTDCSIPLRYANQELRATRFAGCVIVSDNQSWAGVAAGPATPMMEQWRAFAANQGRLGSPGPKLVCIDVQPYGTTQAPDGGDVLNVGGFSDAVFDVVAGFLAGGATFVDEVEAVEV